MHFRQRKESRMNKRMPVRLLPRMMSYEVAVGGASTGQTVGLWKENKMSKDECTSP